MVYEFASDALHSILWSTPDTVAAFAVDPAAGVAAIDVIDVSAIDAKWNVAGNQDFVFIGGASFTAEGQIRATQSGADTIINFNIKGSPFPEMRIVLANFAAETLTSADFVR